MVGFGILLAPYSSFGGGALGDLFAQWEAAGIFAYALPFLLIFAIVYGLLAKLNIFAAKDDPNKGKGINVVIALAVAFMALQFNLVSMFFSEIFPRFGIALSIILVILILGGLFIPTNKENNWFMVALAIVVFLIIAVVIYNSLRTFGWGLGGPGFSYIWNQWGAVIAFGIIFIGIIAMMVGKKDKDRPRFSNLLSKALGGD